MSAPAERRLEAESEIVAHIHTRARADGEVKTRDALDLARALGGLLREPGHYAASVKPIEDTTVTAAHCLNVAMLGMAAAEFLGFGEPERVAIGTAGLLHDIGYASPELATDDQPAGADHTVAGARLLLRSGDRDRLATVVAYEHHIDWQGVCGYPQTHYPRQPHRFSRLIRICDSFDTLRTPRTHRPPLSEAAALELLERRAGLELDPDLVTGFAGLVRSHGSPRIPTDEGADEGELEGLAGAGEARYDADSETEAAAAPDG